MHVVGSVGGGVGGEIPCGGGRPFCAIPCRDGSNIQIIEYSVEVQVFECSFERFRILKSLRF